MNDKNKHNNKKNVRHRLTSHIHTFTLIFTGWVRQCSLALKKIWKTPKLEREWDEQSQTPNTTYTLAVSMAEVEQHSQRDRVNKYVNRCRLKKKREIAQNMKNWFFLILNEKLTLRVNGMAETEWKKKWKTDELRIYLRLHACPSHTRSEKADKCF